MSAMLEVRGLEVNYGHIEAVRGIDLDLNANEITALVGANGAGSLSVSSTGSGVQFNIIANNNQGSTVQRLAQGGLMQNTTLLGGGNQVRNLTSLNVVLRDNVPTASSLNGNLDQLKGLRALGY